MVELLGTLTQSSICTKANQFKLCRGGVFFFSIFHSLFFQYLCHQVHKRSKLKNFLLCVMNKTFKTVFGDHEKSRNPRLGQERRTFGAKKRATKHSSSHKIKSHTYEKCQQHIVEIFNVILGNAQNQKYILYSRDSRLWLIAKIKKTPAFQHFCSKTGLTEFLNRARNKLPNSSQWLTESSGGES